MAKRVQIVFDLIDGEKKPLLEDCLAYYGLNQKQYFNACVDTIIEKATKRYRRTWRKDGSVSSCRKRLPLGRFDFLRKTAFTSK